MCIPHGTRLNVLIRLVCYWWQTDLVDDFTVEAFCQKVVKKLLFMMLIGVKNTDFVKRR